MCRTAMRSAGPAAAGLGILAWGSRTTCAWLAVLGVGWRGAGEQCGRLAAGWLESEAAQHEVGFGWWRLASLRGLVQSLTASRDGCQVPME